MELSDSVWRLVNLRCQVDASWTDSTTGTGLGFVLLELDKEVITGQRKCQQLKSPLHAEAESIYWAMKEISNRSLQQVSFESDCLQVVYIIQHVKPWPALDPERDQIGSICSSFDTFSLSFIHQSLNIRADTFAKVARSVEEDCSLVEVKFPLRSAHEAHVWNNMNLE
ncbi:hypothetical protein F2Q70_00007906 [Brassica cretica]|uniref:RNase H type-1 domain-containing protein n=1 Tax=Brassica cretica TaxID=69181 RepID=A0A8S9M9B2_BRACR|nr:hypothetical protein F2Q70_00007906 [Brassica cretica]